MNDSYATIERAIGFIDEHAERQPALAEMAAHAGLSPFHFQRLFRRWAGISPKRYLEFLTVLRAKHLLAGTTSVLDAAHALGLSGPSRLHEQFVSVEAASPGEFKSGGRGLEIGYGVGQGPFGPVLLAQTVRGICLLAFLGDRGPERELSRLATLYPSARLLAAPAATRATLQRIFASPYRAGERFHLALRGTNLQVQVWGALLQIPPGETMSYQQLARRVGRPRAVRAVANAVAGNPVNYLIPCHRVLRASGALGGFRGGAELKARLLDWERIHPNAHSRALCRDIPTDK